MMRSHHLVVAIAFTCSLMGVYKPALLGPGPIAPVYDHCTQLLTLAILVIPGFNL
jgi:hypothetical protein